MAVRKVDEALILGLPHSYAAPFLTLIEPYALKEHRSSTDCEPDIR